MSLRTCFETVAPTCVVLIVAVNRFALYIVFTAVNILQKLLHKHDDDVSRQPHDTSDNIVG